MATNAAQQHIKVQVCVLFNSCISFAVRIVPARSQRFDHHPYHTSSLYDLFYVRSFVLSAVTLWGLMRYVWNTGEHVFPACVMAYSVIAHLHVFIMTEALSTQRQRALDNIWEGKSRAWKGSKMGKSEKQSKSTSYCMHKKAQIWCVISLHVRCKLRLYSYTWGYFTTVK